MYPPRQVQHDLMAHQTTKPQPAGPRRPHHHPHLQQDADWSRAGRTRDLPETPRKLHYPDRDARKNTRNKDSMKELPRKPVAHQPVSRQPLQPIQNNGYNARSTRVQSYDPPRKQKTDQAVRMSEMYTMIDDHLAWNMSSSDLESPARPGSSGTMFVDFDAAGAMEVSYRHGVNKKLPTPPVPTKTTPVRQAAARKEKKMGVEKRIIRPSYSSRHDSVISSGRPEDEKIDRYFDTRPLPAVPPKDSQRPHVEKKRERRSYPPQVHQTHLNRTQRSSSPCSQTSTSSSYHTAPLTQTLTQGSSYDGVTYTDASGLRVRYHHPPLPHTPGGGSKPAAGAYVSGFDPVTQYAYDYDGRVMHVHGSPTPSRPGSYTSEYFDIPAADYSAGHRRSVDTGSKALPRVPCAGLPAPPAKDAKKRGKVLKFVQKLLGKLDAVGVVKELRENGYVT